MRDYPTVPNVFPVATLHNVDTDCTAAGDSDIKITSGTNANLTIGQLREEQQKQQSNGNISGQPQSLEKSAISLQTIETSTTETIAASTSSSTLNCSKSEQEEQQKNLKTIFDFIQHNASGLQKQHHQKLTTHASIDGPQCSSTSQSPQSTLPRKTESPLTTLSLMTAKDSIITDIDIPKQQQQEQHHKSANNIGNGNNLSQSNKSCNNNHKNNFNDPTMLGVINTISGSIPATGYTIDSLATAKKNPNGLDGNLSNHTISMVSDLNVGMNNSCTNLSKLNGIQEQQHLQHQQKYFTLQQGPQQQQQSTHQHCDFKQTTTSTHDFTAYRRQYPCSSFERNSNGYLWIITPVAASISVAIVIAALAGPQWLFTEEKLPNTLYNGTANFNVLDDGAFITRYTKSSLWIICTTLQGVETYSCIKIDYFSEKGYQPDPHDSASAIPYTVTKSCPFFLASGIVLLLSFIVFLIPTCSHQNNLYYFSAGIMFIVSGLLMLIGLIAYISILKAEIGSKLRPRSTLQPPLFKVTYGQSFFLFVFGFIATEFVGLLNIFLYISLQEVGYYSHLPCFTISNLQEKIKEGENRFNNHTYKSCKLETESRRPLDRIRKQQNKKHQVAAQELEMNKKKLLKNMAQANGRRGGITPRTGRRVVDAVIDTNVGPYACRKHPNSMISSRLFANELDRRYYFEKPSTSSTRSKCNLHSRNLAKSLNELHTESSSTSALLPPPPPPSTMRATSGLQLQTQTLPRPPQQFSDSPQEFPLTRSVSTTTDIYTPQNISFSGMPATKADGRSSNNNNRRRNVATNTRDNSDLETQANVSNAFLQQCNNITHSKNNLSQQQQLRNQRHNKTYQTNFPAATCAKDDDDFVGGAIDTYNNRLRCGPLNGHKLKRSNRDSEVNVNDDNDDNDNDGDDGEEVDDERPQKLCGLKRSIRKTKDELFEDFCKRAGVRPKPKNIYYIDNHEGEDDNLTADENLTPQSAELEEDVQHQPLRLNSVRTGIPQQRHPDNMSGKGEFRSGIENNLIFGDELDVVDIDAEMDEDDFNKITENDEHLYVLDDNIRLMPSSLNSGRRASMYVEPNHLRRLNSNLSLHAIHAPPHTRTGLQKSLYDLDGSGSEFGFFATQHQTQQPHYTLRDNIYGGSQQRLHQDYHNQAMYQSRTLPRTFLKRNIDSQESITAGGLNASTTQLTNLCSASQQKLTTLMMQHQHQLQQQNRYLSMSREQDLYSSRYALQKSNEELNRHYIQQQQQQPIYVQSHQLKQYQQQQQQQQLAVASCTNYNTASSAKQPPLVQWPAAIPTSPSNFSGSIRIYSPAAHGNSTQNTNNNHTLVTRSNSNSGTKTMTAGGQHVVVNGASTGSQGPTKFQRSYAFDEQRRSVAVLADAFDLDEIERERRRSHASLFTLNSNAVAMGGGDIEGNDGVIGNTNKTQSNYDMINGTAV